MGSIPGWGTKVPHAIQLGPSKKNCIVCTCLVLLNLYPFSVRYVILCDKEYSFKDLHIFMFIVLKIVKFPFSVDFMFN